MKIRMSIILCYQYFNFSKYLRYPYIHHVYFVYNFNLSFYLCFFKFVGRRTIVLINGARIDVNNNNNNNNNNSNNNNNNDNNNNSNYYYYYYYYY